MKLAQIYSITDHQAPKRKRTKDQFRLGEGTRNDIVNVKASQEHVSRSKEKQTTVCYCVQSTCCQEGGFEGLDVTVLRL
jgi:hypothetical protein